MRFLDFKLAPFLLIRIPSEIYGFIILFLGHPQLPVAETPHIYKFVQTVLVFHCWSISSLACAFFFFSNLPELLCITGYSVIIIKRPIVSMV